MEKGGISVTTENIFPVIKRWLYSDKDIFLREIISNACDAITKRKRLVSLGNSEAEDGEGDSGYAVRVVVNKDEKTLTVSDNGIGMNADEVRRYINQIALSGALDFIEKYETGDGNAPGIIGHFGLGFYSVFMVSDKAEIITRSWDNSPAVHWSCTETGEYEMEESEREAGRGTDIVLHISDDEASYLDSEKVKSIIRKYCSFMPYPITFVEGENSELLNDTEPLWKKNPQDITEEQYNEFYKRLTGDYEDPLMYVHINADYPLNFKGILYFPKVRNEFESLEPKVSLYYNQVFVSDSIKEALPEFLIYVKGVLDCPELPLNVSRSYLQTNTYVSKVSQHISKKIADRYNYLFTNEREKFEKVYGDLSLFIEYGCIRDEKFYGRIKENLMLTDTDGKCSTLSEYLTGNPEETQTVYYTADKDAHSYYVSVYAAKGIRIAEANRIVDTQFLQFLERKNEKLAFKRIDSSLDAVGGEDDGNKELKTLFAEATGIKEEAIRFSALGEDNAPALITLDEESRRFGDMMKLYGMKDGGQTVTETLTVNTSSPAVERLGSLDGEKKQAVAKYMYMSALQLSRRLTKEETAEYVRLSTAILGYIS